MIVKDETFRGKTFQVAKGSLHPEFSFFTFEEEERDIREKYWNVGEGDIVVDVGASYGSYTLPACAMGASVLAFEPEPWVYKDLVTNLKLNGWWATRCHAFPLALWDSDGEFVTMETYAPHWPKHTISGPYHTASLDLVRSMNPDLPSFTRCDWIKVDVEGAEEHVLRGARETIRRCHPRLIVECHTFLDLDIKDRVVEFLHGLNPDYAFTAVDRPPCVMVVAA